MLEVKILRVIKIWEDLNNADDSRPESITVTLTADGTAIGTFVLNEGNGWTALAENLPAKNGDAEIVYRWIEEAVSGYILTETTDGDTTTLTNTKVTSLTVRKEWNDGNNEQGLRPQSIDMTLMAGETAVVKVTLNAENGWTGTVENLPVSENGVAIQYDWTEPVIANYAQESKTTADGVTVFRNRITRVPQDNRKPRVPTQVWHEFEEYDTALGLGVLINHVGDCFD